MIDRQACADRLRTLHRRGRPLLLPDPWDRGSLRLLEAADCEAVATRGAP